MESKITIRMGAIEIQYEGSEKFLKEELPELLKAVSELYQESHDHLPAQVSPVSANDTVIPTQQKITVSTTTIATKLKAKSGSDLAKSAAAKLAINDGKQQFSRQEILDEMKSATGYYKQTFRGNLTNSLETLVKNSVLLHVSGDIYALAANEKERIQNQIA